MQAIMPRCAEPLPPAYPNRLACPQTATDRLSESRAALEKKAALYDKLARGEVDDAGKRGRWLPLQCCRARCMQRRLRPAQPSACRSRLPVLNHPNPCICR